MTWDGPAKGRKELLQMELQIEGRGLLCLALFRFALQYRDKQLYSRHGEWWVQAKMLNYI